MPKAPVIPPERQSSRKRANVNYDETAAYTLAHANLPIRPQHSSAKLRPDQKHVPTAPPIDEDYDSDENVVEPETEDEDDSQFRSRAKLPPSSVNKWKLAELMGKWKQMIMPEKMTLLTSLPECIDNGLIELCPEYQRDVVWKRERPITPQTFTHLR
jgi:hypothetical protein